jgi:hypothetical protein
MKTGLKILIGLVSLSAITGVAVIVYKKKLKADPKPGKMRIIPNEVKFTSATQYYNKAKFITAEPASFKSGQIIEVESPLYNGKTTVATSDKNSIITNFDFKGTTSGTIKY